MAKKKSPRKILWSREHDVLASVLVQVRQESGLTQRDLAARLKRPHSVVGAIESGDRRIDVVELVAVANALKVDPVQLFARFVQALPS